MCILSPMPNTLKTFLSLLPPLPSTLPRLLSARKTSQHPLYVPLDTSNPLPKQTRYHLPIGNFDGNGSAVHGSGGGRSGSTCSCMTSRLWCALKPCGDCVLLRPGEVGCERHSVSPYVRSCVRACKESWEIWEKE